MEESFQKVLEVVLNEKSGSDSSIHSDVDDYLFKLGQLSFDQVLSEPARLSEESKIVTEQTQELAFTNYKTFVNTADCSKAIMNDFRSSRKSLDKFLQTMPNFIQESEKFSNISREVSLNRSKNTNVQAQSEKLISILELPSLMQHVLNSGDYESAIDLFTYISNRSKKFCDIPIIQSIKSEIIMLWFETLYRLFNQLRYDLPLSQSLQILGYLRRANTVFESTVDDTDLKYDLGTNFKTEGNLVNVGDGLHLNFLKSRQAWFESILLDAMNDENKRQLRKLIELHRVHMFNILTQHKAIFLSENQGTKTKEDELNGISALSTWLKEKVLTLSQLLQQEAPKEDEAEFESLMNQCMYLGLSFSRVGADMRCVLTPVFEDIIIASVKNNLKRADFQFESEMRSFKMIGRKTPTRPSNSEQGQNTPPETLLEFYPLGEYCNNLLNALNSIRVVTPMCLALDIFKLYNESLQSATRVILSYHQREHQIFSMNERKHFTLFCNAYTDNFVPYISKCINQAFPQATIAEQLGVSVTVFQDEKILCINQAQLCDPIINLNEPIK